MAGTKQSDKLIVHQEEPLNAEPPITELVEHPITPEDLVYARNHCELALIFDIYPLPYESLLS